MGDTLDLPVVDLTPLLAAGANVSIPEVLAQSRIAAEALSQYGLLCVRDPRTHSGVTNIDFLNMLEEYFGQPDDFKDPDVRKDIWYQLGRTPSKVELPRNHCKRMNLHADGDKPLSACPPEADAKERFFWRPSGATRPAETKFPQLNAPAVIPAAFGERWTRIMDGWGNKLLDCAFSVATLSALGLGLPAEAFTSRMTHGPHLLAPTASDFHPGKYGKLGQVLAGYHYDLNFLTAHGRSRYPGLAVWTREGHKKWVKIPEGCLLVQAGKQLEWLTGGVIMAGFHEVVVNEATLRAIEAASEHNKSLWRISSTLFSHIASDVLLEPLPGTTDKLADAAAREHALKEYPPMLAGDYVSAELAAINLGAGSVAY